MRHMNSRFTLRSMSGSKTEYGRVQGELIIFTESASVLHDCVIATKAF